MCGRIVTRKCCVALGRYADAIDDYSTVLARLAQPTDLSADEVRGLRLERRSWETDAGVGTAGGCQSKAIEDYGRVIELIPESREAYAERGIAYLEGGQTEQGTQDIWQAIRLNPHPRRNRLSTHERRPASAPESLRHGETQLRKMLLAIVRRWQNTSPPAMYCGRGPCLKVCRRGHATSDRVGQWRRGPDRRLLWRARGFCSSVSTFASVRILAPTLTRLPPSIDSWSTAAFELNNAVNAPKWWDYQSRVMQRLCDKDTVCGSLLLYG